MDNKLLYSAYLAGYVDGDGCLCIGKTIQKPKNIVVYEYSIQIASVKIGPLEFFKEEFGGSIHRKPDKLNHKPIFCWSIKNDQCKSSAIRAYPYLLDKKKACAYFINYIDQIRHNRFRKVPEQTLLARDYLITKIKEEKHMNDFVTKEKIDSLKYCESINPIEENYAYLAGLIDAEGCFRIKKWKPRNKPNHVYTITLEIGNTRFPIFPWLVERFGGSVVFIPEKGKRRQSATWSLSAFALSKVIPNILPFIRCKKEAAKKVLEFYATNLCNGGDRHSAEFKKLYAEKLIERERIVDEIHKLNLKGLKL